MAEVNHDPDFQQEIDESPLGLQQREEDAQYCQISNRSFNAHNEIHHFHGVHSYLAQKTMEIPGNDIRNLTWNANDGSVAFSQGPLLKTLKLKPSRATGVQNPAGADTPEFSVSRTQLLKGHSVEIHSLSFNMVHDVLASGDCAGHTIVWRQHKEEWFPDVNHKNGDGSSVSGLGWSPDGSKLCIVNEKGTTKIGSLNGDHVWTRQYGGVNPGRGVVWSPDSTQILIPTTDGELLAYYAFNGDYVGKANFHNMDSKSASASALSDFACESKRIVAICWRHCSRATSTTDDLPKLSVMFQSGVIYMLRGLDDSQPLILTTNLIVACGAWSPDGNYFAVCGQVNPPRPIRSKVSTSGHVSRPNKVLLFNSTGHLLQDISVPGNGISKPFSSLAWHSESRQLALAAGSKIYFANVCPQYKFTFYAGSIFVYAFGNGNGNGVTYLSFGDQEKFFKQRIPGFVVDLKGNDEVCAVLACSREGNYSVRLVNEQRLVIKEINIESIQPFALVLTDSTVCSIAPNAVRIWKHKVPGTNIAAQTDLDVFTECFKSEKVFHLDETSDQGRQSSRTPAGLLEENHMHHFENKTSEDPAICADGTSLILVVGRASGKIMVYSLLFEKLIATTESVCQTGMNIELRRVFINSNGTEIALLDKTGILFTHKLAGQGQPGVVKIFDKRDIWDIAWAKDNPNILCIMEKTNLHVVENDEIQDTIRVPSPACLVQVRNLQVTAVLMHELITRPESPKPSMFLKFDTKMLREMKSLIARNVPPSKIQAYVERSNHPSLWTVLGQFALQTLDFDAAETAFVKCQDYAGLQLLKKLAIVNGAEKLMQGALIASHFEDFQYAQQQYLENDRSDLAIKMWAEIEDWRNLKLLYDSLLPAQKPNSVARRPAGQMHASIKGDRLFANLDAGRAIVYFGRGKNLGCVLDCAMALENCNILEDIRENFPEDEEIASRIEEYMKIWEDV